LADRACRACRSRREGWKGFLVGEYGKEECGGVARLVVDYVDVRGVV
jgi:hypothetical protein